MSYIRCLSNPEGLYVYESLANTLEWIRPYPQASASCDWKDFRDFVIAWNELSDDRFDYKGFSYSYENRHVDADTGAGKFKVYLTISGIEFEMWDVTWMYIVHSFVNRELNNLEYKLLYGNWFEKLLGKILVRI